MKQKPPRWRLLLLLGTFIGVTGWAIKAHQPAPTLPPPLLIAHALGGLDGRTHTNSKDAFLHNYQQGFRLFEIDLSLTQDGHLCAFHPRHTLEESRADTPPPSKARLLQHGSEQQFTPLCMEEFTALLQSYPDAVFIIDVKHHEVDTQSAAQSHQHAFRDIYRRLHEHWREPDGESQYWNQIIPQVYGEQDLRFLESLGPSPCVIYTLYKQDQNYAQLLELLDTHPQIQAVAIDHRRFNPPIAAALISRGKQPLAHTVNDPGVMQALQLAGVTGFFTDFHPPASAGAGTALQHLCTPRISKE